MNTGHEGGCATVHANSAADVPSRIEGLALAAGLSREAVHSQLHAALDVVIHLGRSHDGLRRVREIGVLARVGHEVEVVTAVAFDDAGVLVDGPARSVLAALVGG